MDLLDKQIEEYKKIYKKEFGEDISDEEAHEQGERLVRLFELVFKDEG